MRPHIKGDGNAVSAAQDGDPPVSVGRASAHTSVAAVSSWRPSAGLSSIERYGRFEILGRVGRGGMAEILLARERSPAGSTRHLVIKRVLPEIQDSDEMLGMFLDEARVVMGLFHPNLCQIYEVGEQDGAWFIAMEWVNGATLHQLLRRAVSESDFDYVVLARVISLCAEALHHAHTARDAEGRPLHLVHRDVSPHNIMVGYDGRVKLLDFGIAKSARSTHHTEAGVVKGKVCYMSPEQWLCGPLDGRTDVFALGACLYEALTGQVVFKRETQSEVMHAVLQEGVPPMLELAPEVPRELAAITHRALAFAAEDRFQSAQEMSDALEEYLTSLSTPLPASKVAAYVRRLFRSEVELGPLLERTVRGAHLPAYDVVLPPLPPALLGLPKLTAAMLGLPDNDGEQRALGPTSHIKVAPLERLSLVNPTLTVRDAELARAEPPPGFDDLTQSVERPLSAPPMLPPASLGDAAPEPPPAPVGDARQALRTVSMRARGRMRWAMILGLPACAALLVGLLAVQRQTQPEAAARALRSQPSPPRAAASAAAPRLVESPPRAEPPLAEQQVEGPPTAPVSAPAPRDTRHGRLSINTRPWSTVYLGSRVLGTTPLADVSVPRTALTLKLVDRDGNVHLRKVARTRKAERSAFYDLDAPKKRVRRAK